MIDLPIFPYLFFGKSLVILW